MFRKMLFEFTVVAGARPRQLRRYPASLFEKKDKPARDLSLAHRARRAAWLLALRVVCAPRLLVLAREEKQYRVTMWGGTTNR